MPLGPQVAEHSDQPKCQTNSSKTTFSPNFLGVVKGKENAVVCIFLLPFP